MRARPAEFQPDRLRQARLHRQLTMKELADRLGITRQAISSFERRESSPSPRTLRDLARELNVPEPFLTMPIRLGENTLQSAVTYRSLAASSVRSRNQAKVCGEWASSLVASLSRYVSFPPVRLPVFSLADCISLPEDEIDECAERTRRFFGLGDGPISDLTLLLENHGVIVLFAPLDSGIDGVSAWYQDRPFVVINRRAVAVRARFDVAHELAHLVLHRDLSQEEIEQNAILKKVERAANRFASAFLMPERTFAAEVYGLDMVSLLPLKRRWLVSLQAMIQRLYAVGLVSEHKRTRMFQELSKKGQRKREPLDDTLEPERSRVLTRVCELLEKQGVATLSDIFTDARLPEWFLSYAMNLHPEQADLHAGKVVQIRS